MRLIFASFALAFCAQSAAALEYACTFTLECIEGETCESTDYTIEVIPDPGEKDFLVLQTASGNVSGQLERSHAVFSDETALHVLSTNPKGEARYTVHLRGPMAITYHGSCKVKD